MSILRESITIEDYYFGQYGLEIVYTLYGTEYFLISDTHQAIDLMKDAKILDPKRKGIYIMGYDGEEWEPDYFVDEFELTESDALDIAVAHEENKHKYGVKVLTDLP